jgi:hypothetical protein
VINRAELRFYSTRRSRGCSRLKGQSYPTCYRPSRPTKIHYKELECRISAVLEPNCLMKRISVHYSFALFHVTRSNRSGKLCPLRRYRIYISQKNSERSLYGKNNYGKNNSDRCHPAGISGLGASAKPVSTIEFQPERKFGELWSSNSTRLFAGFQRELHTYVRLRYHLPASG